MNKLEQLKAWLKANETWDPSEEKENEKFAALLEDAERSRVVLCRECRYWIEYISIEHGECYAPGPKKDPWPGAPYHDTTVSSCDFGCVCGVRK